MTFLAASASSTLVTVNVWTLVFLMRPATAQEGTTANIKHIVLGRCHSYMNFVDPTMSFDCEEIWRQFEDAVGQRSPCNVTAEHYHHMFLAMPQTRPCDRFLFWSRTRTVMRSYATVLGHFWTLEDTLVGYLFNDLVWCGRDDDLGFDFRSCPQWSACAHHPVFSLWRLASQKFAEAACGNITVLLNGSIGQAFDRYSIFGSVELESLNPERVNYVNIKVVTNLGGPSVESCGQGSIVDLIQILKFRGFRWTCTDHDPSLVILQCVQEPTHPACRTWGPRPRTDLN
ncbi:ADP-ribosyl cyclase/cyclic ADP-ribose hydrolase 1-like [Neosynchiropus ocellatus]